MNIKSFMPRLSLLLMLILCNTNIVPAEGISIPYEPENNRIRLIASINGNPIRLLLDSGATTTVLFKSTAKYLSHVKRVNKINVAFPALDNVFQGERLLPFDIAIDTLKFEISNSVILDTKGALQSQLMLGYDGILGQEFFTKYTIEIDPTAHIVTLYPVGTDLGHKYKSSQPLYMQGAAPHIRFRSKLPWEKSPRLKQMLLDTGYPGAMVIWNEAHFRAAEQSGEGKKIKKLGTGIVTRAAFRFGNLHFRETPIFLGPNSPVQTNKRDGLIGGNILNNFKYAIDFKLERLWMLSLQEKGNQLRIIDNTIYVPNDEDFVIRDFNKRPSVIRKTTIE